MQWFDEVFYLGRKFTQFKIDVSGTGAFYAEHVEERESWTCPRVLMLATVIIPIVGLIVGSIFKAMDAYLWHKYKYKDDADKNEIIDEGEQWNDAYKTRWLEWNALFYRQPSAQNSPQIKPWSSVNLATDMVTDEGFYNELINALVETNINPTDLNFKLIVGRCSQGQNGFYGADGAFYSGPLWDSECQEKNKDLYPEKVNREDVIHLIIPRKQELQDPKFGQSNLEAKMKNFSFKESIKTVYYMKASDFENGRLSKAFRTFLLARLKPKPE